MDNNWVVDNLQNAFITWNTKMEEMWSLLTESPETFKGGTIWNTIVTINGGMQAIGYGLLVLFFAISLFRSAASFRDFQRPEYVVRHLIQFVLAKVAITYGMDFLTKIFAVCNGIVATAAGSIGGTDGASSSQLNPIQKRHLNIRQKNIHTAPLQNRQCLPPIRGLQNMKTLRITLQKKNYQSPLIRLIIRNQQSIHKASPFQNLLNGGFADAVGFAVPYPLSGVAGRFPFRRGLRGFLCGPSGRALR